MDQIRTTFNARVDIHESHKGNNGEGTRVSGWRIQPSLKKPPTDQKTGIKVELVKGSYGISENLSTGCASTRSGLGPRPVLHVAKEQ